MSSKSKGYFLLALFVAICIICFLLRGRIKEALTIHDIKTIERLQDKAVDHWFDINGNAHSTQEEAQVSSIAARVSMKNEFDAQAKLLKIKAKNITGINGIGMVDTGLILAHYIDSFSKITRVIHLPGGKTDTVERHFEYVDDHIYVDGLVGKRVVQIHYEHDDSLTLVSYTKRKWFLGKQRTYVDAKLEDPNSYVRGMSGIRINTKVPGRFNIGPFVGYDLAHMQFGFGVSIQYALIRF